MTRYAADSRDRVFDAVDMVALIADRVELRRQGVNSYFGNCPFHDERTDSFHVSPDEKLYHCFGCQASGDAFNYVIETEGVDFKGALESLASRFGVTLETVDENPEALSRRRELDRLTDLLDRTATYYARYLWESAEAADARAYLWARGLSEEVLRTFRVGYSPSAWDRILLASRRNGYTEQELLEVGLAVRSRSRPGSVYDAFRGQIMFPTADARGRVRGFGARRMRDDANGGRPGPKYINTADGRLYHKREVLFGIDQARGPAAKAGRMILVEGYTDVLALHQVEIRNAVGIMGTSLTTEQVAELARTVPVVELCLDADGAGQQAMLRAADAARGTLELRVVRLPEGSDPAELVVAEGAEGLRARVDASVPFVVFEVERILAAADTDSAEGRDRALAALAPVLGRLDPSVLRDELVRRVSGVLALREAQVPSLLATAGSRSSGVGGAPARRSGVGGEPGVGGMSATSGSPGARGAGDREVGDERPTRGGPGVGPVSQAVRTEQLFLALCLAVPDAGEAALAAPDAEQLLTSAQLRRAAVHLRGHLRSPESELPAGDESLAAVIDELVRLSARVPLPSADRVEHARLLLELERVEREIQRARSDRSPITELAQRRETLRTSLWDVGTRLEKTI